MPLYMTQFSYTSEAWAALAKNPADRSIALKALIEKFGGRLISFYYIFGDYDGFLIYEIPDNTTAMAAVLAGIAPGHLKSTKTTVLFSPEQGMEALKKAGTVAFPAPSK